jgi:hypothetical protein
MIIERTFFVSAHAVGCLFWHVRDRLQPSFDHPARHLDENRRETTDEDSACRQPSPAPIGSTTPASRPPLNLGSVWPQQGS